MQFMWVETLAFWSYLSSWGSSSRKIRVLKLKITLPITKSNGSQPESNSSFPFERKAINLAINYKNFNNKMSILTRFSRTKQKEVTNAIVMLWRLKRQLWTNFDHSLFCWKGLGSLLSIPCWGYILRSFDFLYFYMMKIRRKASAFVENFFLNWFCWIFV